jgi:hypothetical protein
MTHILPFDFFFETTFIKHTPTDKEREKRFAWNNSNNCIKLTSNEMWIPKSKEEIEAIDKKRKKDALKASIIFPVIAIVLTVIFLKYIKVDNVGLRHGSKDLLSWSQVFDTYPLLLFLVFLTSLSGYTLVRGSKSSTLVCNKCNKVIAYQKEKICDCSGTYVPIADMNWVDNRAEKHKKAEKKNEI